MEVSAGFPGAAEIDRTRICSHRACRRRFAVASSPHRREGRMCWIASGSDENLIGRETASPVWSGARCIVDSCRTSDVRWVKKRAPQKKTQRSDRPAVCGGDRLPTSPDCFCGTAEDVSARHVLGNRSPSLCEQLAKLLASHLVTVVQANGEHAARCSEDWAGERFDYFVGMHGRRLVKM